MTDWPALVASLEQHLRHIDIATYCERSEGWVGLLKRGVIKDPPHTQGELLLELAGQFGIDPQHPQVGSSQSA